MILMLKSLRTSHGGPGVSGTIPSMCARLTISRCGEDNSQLTEKMKRIKGQAQPFALYPTTT